MSYIHIDNLYRKPEFLDLFKTVWVMEKIDGTSGYIILSPEGFHCHSGGATHSQAIQLFNQNELLAKYTEMANDCIYKIHGEFFGGKIQGLSNIYGKELRFVAFDVKFSKGDHHGHWMNVPDAAGFCHKLGIEFVDFHKTNNSLEILTVHRDRSSIQADRNGMGIDKPREGIVIRPLQECYDQWGERWIIKYKQERKRETATPREVTKEKLQILSDANAVADEWVTSERLAHVLNDKNGEYNISMTGEVVKKMIEDVKRESGGEVVWSKDVERAIGTKTASLFKETLQVKINADN